MMKVCKKCGLDKPLSEFSKSGFRNGKQVYKSRCKKCLSKENNIWYFEGGGKETRDVYNKKYHEDGRKENRRKNRLQEAKDYLGNICWCCGATENLQFDHIDPKTKSFNINAQDSWEKLIPELDKCQLLCPPCHLKKTLTIDLPIIMEKKKGLT